MATAQLSALPRKDTGKGAARTLRRDGRFPAVIYGHSREPLPLSVPSREFERLLERVAAENTVIELSIDGTMARTLIREIQRHPVKRNVLHVDFQELVAGERVIVSIPIVLQGTAEGVRNAGGILSQVMQELECRVDPLNMPPNIVVDVTNVSIGHSIHVSEMVIPEGVEVLEDPEATVAVVAAPRVEEETPAPGAAPEAAAEPELIRKPKEDEEAETEES
ncbi:MAG TPA: 50S ribosomal protein L25/general stress protein Ctc [Gemmatimonadaceae bacterium]